MKGYLFDTIGIAVIILTILIMFLFFNLSSEYFVQTAPNNLTNETYTQIKNSFVTAQTSFPIIFIIMYLIIIAASSTVQTHPAVLVVSGIMLVFGMIMISVFEDVFAFILTLIPSGYISTEFQNVIDNFKIFSILTGISVIVIGLIKTSRNL